MRCGPLRDERVSRGERVMQFIPGTRHPDTDSPNPSPGTGDTIAGFTN